MSKNYMKDALLALVWAFCSLSFSFLQAAHDPSDHATPIVTPQEGNKLCLTMIVKNESGIIERCLTNVKDIVDCISICDTGSTDHTVQIIEAFIQKNGIPGKVHQHSWKNFGHNRTLSAQAAQKTLEEFGFPLSNTYLLFLDADMILEIDPQFNKNQLKADEYLLVQRSSWQSYYNTRLARASLPWESVGVTHEYWSSKTPHRIGKLSTLQIDDRNDGGCKADKFERDIRLLTQGLKDEPDNERYLFYLAESYQCLNRYDEAIKWYKNRIKKGRWNEEVWYSKFMIGECYENMGRWNRALHWYLDAYQYNPERAEPLQKIATHYRLNSKPHLAYIFAKEGSRIPYPENQILFITHPVYDYQLDEEISIAAYYSPFKSIKEEGFAAANRLALKKDIPSPIKDQNKKNLVFYVNNLQQTRFVPININLPLIREGFDAVYNPMNPSIQKTDDGYDLICRTVNFGQKGAMDYFSRDPLDDTIRTKNFLVHYDRDFNLMSQKEIIEDLPRQRFPTKVVGLEDCRLMRLNNDLWFITTTRDTHPGAIDQSLGKLANESSDSAIYVEKLLPLEGPHKSPNHCEKNWLPFIKDNELYVIYSYDPFVIYKINRDNGVCETVLNDKPSHDFSHFRGSAAPIKFDDGYLVLVHEVVFNNQRYYLHRFLYLDKDFNVKKLSKPFTFMHKGVEYCCGMTIDHSGKKCVLSIGLEDCKAFLAFIDLETIRILLEPLP